MRLQLFMRTVRESQKLADLVLSLRLPYMTREASKSDLARTVSVLRHVRYVDLPVGFFSDEPASYTLKQELMAKCPDIRRMTYTHGSEMSISRIVGAKLWTNLESLELSGLHVDEGTLLQVLGSFPALRSLKLENLASIGDSVFTPFRAMPNFPPIERLIIRNMTSITADGLATNLSVSQNQHALETLGLTQTGVRPESLHMILSRAPRLKSLTLELDVETSFPAQEIPLLTSSSVEIMHYEITSTGSPSGMQTVASSYYNYLISSLKSNSLPALRHLYALDPRFIDMLPLASPKPDLQQPLALYTKGPDDFEWNITQYEPTATGKRTSVTRPVSFHLAQLSPRWGVESRQSVLVGNGFGGYLAVPVDEEGPASSGEKSTNRRDSKYDLWR
ncbi:hypothetical protein UA08_00526 [Talaromyces atroroseus]|uniref:F-box domain-containing protein n=1 Tax=Talaromyces atroroseus TaxID=1441469 RepID=A0A225B9E4_TALAT|nr:hypothetical protein UA08_00526 [Talaromyces atroroseus]OKL64709.1 hypothetical protein UA08_00526 [Talaromyces atroroseus]